MATPDDADSRNAGLHVVILAAGLGKRMNSELPKVLHHLGGRALLEHVVDTASGLDPQCVHVVYGHGGSRVPDALAHLEVQWVEQAERLGTGHAVARALPRVPDGATVLVLYGDVPLANPETLRETVGAGRGGLAVVSVSLDDPTGYGRIVRDPGGAVLGVVEEKDATTEQRRIPEINTGIMAAGAARLRRWLARLTNDNAQGEYYLTDVVAEAVADGLEVRTVAAAALEEVLGVNDRVQLADLERRFQRRRARELMLAGVTLLDPARLDVRGQVRTGRDVRIDVNVVLEGTVALGDGVVVGPNCVIRDSVIASGTEILANCVIEEAEIGRGCRVGPFARIRPETRLAENVHVGNFVEVKKSSLGPRSKANHLTYLGDAEVGSDVNVGAGTITCNYDGANKHRTVIGDRAFIGSGVELVAPVTVHSGSTIGAGSTITEDAPPDSLTVARSRQTSLSGWRRPRKKEPT